MKKFVFFVVLMVDLIQRKAQWIIEDKDCFSGNHNKQLYLALEH